jgi:subtilisin family serine protease
MALSHAIYQPTSRGISSFDIFRVSFALLLIFSLVLSTDMAGFTTTQTVPAQSSSGRYVPGSFMPGEVVVKFKEPVGGTRVNNMGLNPDRLLQDSVNKTYGLTGYQELDQMPGYYRFLARPDSNMEKLIAAISLDPQVQYAEPNYIVHANGNPPDDPFYTQTYTDTSGYPQSRQWYLSKIGITELWNVVTGTNYTIAVLDTGVNPFHEDLCFTSPGYTFITNTVTNYDNPFNAYCGKYNWPLGYTFTDNSSFAGALDDNGHGTAVAGIIGANTDNGTGIAGINWNAVILPVKVLDANGNGTVTTVSQGLRYAANQGARIINLSWSVEASVAPSSLQDSINYAQSRGALIVASVKPVTRGTNPFPPSTNITSFPAAFPGVIGVGATDEFDNVIDSGYSDYISVVAPGKDIFTTYCDFVTPLHKGDKVEVGSLVPNGPDQFPDPTTRIKQYSVTQLTTKYAYADCSNPDPQKYPVTTKNSVILDPCTLGNIFSCAVSENTQSLPDGDPIVIDSPPVSVTGGSIITRTTTIFKNQVNFKSYYAFVDGSSFSAAIVSGLASLILSANPGLSNAQVKTLLESTTDQLLPSQVTNGQQGHGRVNAAKIAQAIIQGGTVIPQPPTASGVRGTVTGIDDPANTELNLDPANLTVTPNPDGGFLFDNLAAGTYYLRLRVKSSGRIMGPVKIMLTGAVGEEFNVTFDVNANLITCGPGSVCPTNGPDPNAPNGAFNRASPMPGSLYFTETGHNISNGFKDYWIKNGGLSIFGYPLSEEFTEVSPTDGRTYTVQYFQRNRFEYHPEKQPPYQVLLGLLGSEATTGKIDFPPVDPIPPTANAVYFSETGHTLKNQFLAYWKANGGLAIFGYPISEAFQDGPYYVQYFQRNRFELHPENYGTPYEVLLGLLGTDLARNRGYIP